MVQINEDALAEICARHDVRVLKIFGSASRGEDRPDSDVDFLVEFEGVKSLFDLIGLELELKDFLGREVDLLTLPSISPYLRDRIVAEARVVYDRAG
ncbi:MAG: type VII toxin-antitoxin system MntA family adenylyltransferase antitoxin [Longimicrobiales bacterium]